MSKVSSKAKPQSQAATQPSAKPQKPAQQQVQTLGLGQKRSLSQATEQQMASKTSNSLETSAKSEGPNAKKVQQSSTLSKSSALPFSKPATTKPAGPAAKKEEVKPTQAQAEPTKKVETAPKSKDIKSSTTVISKPASQVTESKTAPKFSFKRPADFGDEEEEEDEFYSEDEQYMMYGDEDEDGFFDFDEDEDGYFGYFGDEDEDEDEDENDDDDYRGFQRLAQIAKQLHAEGYKPYQDGESENEEDIDEDTLHALAEEDEDEDEDDFLRNYFGTMDEDEDGTLEFGEEDDDEEEDPQDNDELLSFDPNAPANKLHADSSSKATSTEKSKNKGKQGEKEAKTKAESKADAEEEEEEEVDEIQAEFDYRTLDPDTDYHTVKGFVSNITGEPKTFKSNEFADLIVNQSEVGSAIVSGDAGSEPLAFATFLDVTEHAKLESMRQVKSFILDNAGKFKAQLEELFAKAPYPKSSAAANKKADKKAESKESAEPDSGRLALLVQDRIVNLPVELVPHLYSEVLKDLEWAHKESKGKRWKFEQVLMIAKCSEVTSSRLGKKSKKASEGEYWYTKFEDEIFAKEATLIRTFPGSGTVSWPDYGQLPVSYRVMVVPMQGFRKVVNYLLSTFSAHVQGRDTTNE